MKYARAHRTAAEMSTAAGNVQRRRLQGLSVLQLGSGVDSVNMLHCYQEMLRPRCPGLEHRLDGNAVERR